VKIGGGTLLRNRGLHDLIAMLDGFRDRGIQTLIGAAALVACALLWPMQAVATLVLSPDGATVYDTVNNITWLADANLAATNRFGIATCKGAGPQPCINASGSMQYQGAAAWVAAMNAANYLGHGNWQIPTTPITDSGCGKVGPQDNSFGFGCTLNALGSLYYNALGLKAPNTAVPIPGNTAGPFSNFQPNLYWSQTIGGSPADACYASMGCGNATLSFNTGFQGANTLDNFLYVLPMIAGKIAGTPAATGTGLQVNPGGQTIYDPVANVTWPANANLAASNTFGIPTCTSATAPAVCVSRAGAMTLASALQFIADMNATAYLGQTNWELPPIDRSCNGYNCNAATNPLGELFYSQLGFSEGMPVVATPDIAVGPFNNIQPYLYWSCQANAIQYPCQSDGPATGFEWTFSFGNGFLGTDILQNEFYVTAYFVGPPTSAAPVITSLNPTSATAAGAAFTLTVNGTGFVSGATVQWNGAPLPTTFVSATQLTASVSAGLIASTGNAGVAVANPGGISSNTVTFPINASAAAGPAITSVSPSSAPAGSPAVIVTITGSGFASTAGARFNGLSPLVTTYVSSTTLTAQISANDLITQGTGQITVANSTGPPSNSFPFVISSPSPLQLLTVAPCRVMDTRNPNGSLGGPFVGGGTTRTIPIPSSSCHIPANASTYSLNFTVVPRAGALSYLTVWPTGQTQPLVSTLNSPDGSTIANAAIVPAGSSGAINAYATNDTDLIVDINGYFVPPTTGTLQFYTLPPCRVLDTRNANGAFGGPSIAGSSSRSFPIPSSSCGAPANAAAYSFNVTVVPQGALGYLTAWPTGQAQPLVSTLNSFDGTTLANAAIVPAGTGGAASFYASNTTNLVVDINGYFAPPGSGGLNFYPVTPCRLVDTRNPNGTLGGPTMGAGTTRAFPLAQGSCGLPGVPGAQAYSLNMTVVPQGALSYLSTWPAGGTQPVVSTLNAFKGQVVANAAIVLAGAAGSVDVYVTNTTDVVIDTNGYFGP
jgi:hypothetical protein